MADRTTSDLTRDLMNQSNIDLYLRNNIASFAEQSVAEQLTELYEKKQGGPASAKYTFIRSFLAGETLRATGSSASVSGWAPHWTRFRLCSSGSPMRRSTPKSSGTPSSASALSTIWT